MKRTVVTMVALIILLSLSITKVRAEGINNVETKEDEIENSEELNNVFKNLTPIQIKDIKLSNLQSYTLEESKNLIEPISIIDKAKLENSLYKIDNIFKGNELVLKTNYEIGKLLSWKGMYEKKGYSIVEHVIYVPVGYVKNQDIIFCEIKLNDFIIEETEFAKCFTTLEMQYVKINKSSEVIETN